MQRFHLYDFVKYNDIPPAVVLEQMYSEACEAAGQLYNNMNMAGMKDDQLTVREEKYQQPEASQGFVFWSVRAAISERLLWQGRQGAFCNLMVHGHLIRALADSYYKT